MREASKTSRIREVTWWLMEAAHFNIKNKYKIEIKT
jgi:hypothetical protein